MLLIVAAGAARQVPNCSQLHCSTCRQSAWPGQHNAVPRATHSPAPEAANRPLGGAATPCNMVTPGHPGVCSTPPHTAHLCMQAPGWGRALCSLPVKCCGCALINSNTAGPLAVPPNTLHAHCSHQDTRKHLLPSQAASYALACTACHSNCMARPPPPPLLDPANPHHCCSCALQLLDKRRGDAGCCWPLLRCLLQPPLLLLLLHHL